MGHQRRGKRTQQITEGAVLWKFSEAYELRNHEILQNLNAWSSLMLATKNLNEWKLEKKHCEAIERLSSIVS